ncbi:hypothetical protein BGLA2_30091 [Burkholderia gladioli]|nr:hypothetical protein BGLA2_30091 [Burkholderia gladioli]
MPPRRPPRNARPPRHEDPGSGTVTLPGTCRREAKQWERYGLHRAAGRVLPDDPRAGLNACRAR